MKSKEIRGLIEDESGRRPFVLRISEPQESDAGDYFCRIDFPAVGVIGNNLKIFGIDAKQAKALSLQFIRKTISNRKLFHKNGRPMKILSTCLKGPLSGSKFIGIKHRRAVFTWPSNPCEETGTFIAAKTENHKRAERQRNAPCRRAERTARPRHRCLPASFLPRMGLGRISRKGETFLPQH